MSYSYACFSGVFSNSVSNSYSCPRDGYRNWAGRNNPDKPIRGYPGWEGGVHIFYSKKPDVFGGMYANNTLLHTGTGGYGAYKFQPWGINSVRKLNWVRENGYYHFGKYKEIYPLGYEGRIYLDDFKGIRTQALLSNTSVQTKLAFCYDAHNAGKIEIQHTKIVDS